MKKKPKMDMYVPGRQGTSQSKERDFSSSTYRREGNSIDFLLTGNAMKVKDELPRVQPVKASGGGKREERVVD